MNDNYRLPTLLVVGAGASGVAAAAECALLGYPTKVVDKQPSAGGWYLSNADAPVVKNLGFRRRNLKHTKVKQNAESVREHIESALNHSGAELVPNSTVTGAEFDWNDGLWNVQVEGPNETYTLRADVVILATGNGDTTGDNFTDGKGNRLEVSAARLHQGIEPLDSPNLLTMNGSDQFGRTAVKRPWQLIEARADHCWRYLRLLEVQGVGAIEVNKALWRVSPSTLTGAVKDLRECERSTHVYTRIEQ
ncbi:MULTISPECIES: FAD-dependent oxidoreductase [Corynebacterium]|uniref:FAD-dependent oxidoreductase n=1 Tax=Corynebacterium TaxID=1716 RepID=UPI0018838B57|nr:MULTISPECIES: FAD-dependent oxidoreductase [Corynebacterium]MBF0581267.1 FAD-dependent oxidoreductase [Corynebacterium sp. ED61]